MIKFLKLTALLLLAIAVFSVNGQSQKVSYFIAGKKNATPIYIDEQADSLIIWAVNDLADDIGLITGNRPIITAHTLLQKVPGIYIGVCTDALLKSTHLQKIKEVQGQWEKYYVHNHESNLIITGSDIRGTVYGIFEVARRLGISPWKWWADVRPMHKDVLTLNLESNGIAEQPSVQYRGIFLNDEDWGLQPWAAKTFEPETGDIGPKTYEKIFQLLLRLKANTIWPAMHPCTKAFYSIAGNKEMAKKYHIVVGTSHAEPMMRNNVDEWKHDQYGDFNFFTNKDSVLKYWQARINEIADADNVVTLGMRGVHDGQMEGNKSLVEKKNMLEEIISLQQAMLSNTKHKPIDSIPQTLVLYKEVLELYNLGLKVPDNVTLMWCDDNYGYIRHLSNEAEQKRAGSSGVYYHLSYWGAPHDYLWLSTMQPALIWWEMTKAYANGANKIWIANVGDIKPSEYNMEFFLDLAWNINIVDRGNIDKHLAAWAGREFGESTAAGVSHLMNEFYRLAFLRKPEFMGWSMVEPETQVAISQFNTKANGNELMRRLSLYDELMDKEELIKKEVSPERREAWFQLVEYPVKGAAYINRKFLFAQMAAESVDTTTREAFIKLSKEAYHDIEQLTTYYNRQMSSGKWNYMMSMEPRNLNVFKIPGSIFKDKGKIDTNSTIAINQQKIFMQGHQFAKNKGVDDYTWEIIQGLGYSNAAVTLSPFTIQHFKEEDQPWIEYAFTADKPGDFELQVRCLPTHSNSYDQQIGVQIDGGAIKNFGISTREKTAAWKLNVLRNSQLVTLKSNLSKAGQHNIRLYVNQTGIIIDQLAVDFTMDHPFYEIPFK